MTASDVIVIGPQEKRAVHDLSGLGMKIEGPFPAGHHVPLSLQPQPAGDRGDSCLDVKLGILSEEGLPGLCNNDVPFCKVSPFLFVICQGSGGDIPGDRIVIQFSSLFKEFRREEAAGTQDREQDDDRAYGNRC